MKRLFFAIIALAAMAFTSCYAYLIDWEATPETDIVQIPQEGGRYYFENFESKKVGTTRMYDPGKILKCMRYRLILGEEVGTIIHDNGMPLGFEVPANENDTERRVTLELSKAKDFHMSLDECDAADLSEEDWEEWQAVWFGVQAGR